MSNETSPLLGGTFSSIPTPVTALALRPARIHFLDNLRATLTALLILHHAVLESVLSSDYQWRTSHKALLLPLSLFSTTNASTLWFSFFLVSGYSTSLSLEVKSDRQHFLSRTLKIGVPAFIYGCLGQLVLFMYLAFTWERIFGSYKSAWAYMRLSGPVSYVLVLMLLEYGYLLIRWSNRHPFSRYIHEIRPMHRGRFFMVVGVAGIAIMIFTFMSCIDHGVPPLVLQYFFVIGFEIPRPDAPVAYIVAYIAGIHLTSVEKHLFPSSSKIASAALLASLCVAYLTMGIAQRLSPSLWEFIRIHDRFENSRMFYDGGFNAHTLFFVLWNLAVAFSIPFFLIATFASSSWTRKEWGIGARHTYFQTYIHMIPVLVAVYHLRGIHNIVGKSVLVGILGVLGSWMMAIPVFALLSWR